MAEENDLSKEEQERAKEIAKGIAEAEGQKSPTDEQKEAAESLARIESEPNGHEPSETPGSPEYKEQYGDTEAKQREADAAADKENESRSS